MIYLERQPQQWVTSSTVYSSCPENIWQYLASYHCCLGYTPAGFLPRQHSTTFFCPTASHGAGQVARDGCFLCYYVVCVWRFLIFAVCRISASREVTETNIKTNINMIHTSTRNQCQLYFTDRMMRRSDVGCPRRVWEPRRCCHPRTRSWRVTYILCLSQLLSNRS